MSVIGSLPSAFNPRVAAALTPVRLFLRKASVARAVVDGRTRLVNVDAMIRNEETRTVNVDYTTRNGGRGR